MGKIFVTATAKSATAGLPSVFRAVRGKASDLAHLPRGWLSVVQSETQLCCLWSVQIVPVPITQAENQCRIDSAPVALFSSEPERTPTSFGALPRRAKGRSAAELIPTSAAFLLYNS